ncbi:MAG TPA: ChbG/HpnK family deacetylase [Gemmatimonadaceae bacterium]
MKVIQLPDLIVTADDFGMSQSRNRAIFESLGNRHVTHASMIVNLAAFEPAVKLARSGGFEDRIGLHLNLTQGRPLTKAMTACPRFCAEGRFRFPMPGRGIWPLSRRERAAVAEETRAQMSLLRDAGFPITYLDSHHHVHLELNLAPIILPIVREFGVPRMRSPGYSGLTYGMLLGTKEVLGRRYLELHRFLHTRFFGDIALARTLVAQRGRDALPIEVMTHPNLNGEGVVVDGSDEDRLVDRLLTLRPYFESSISELGTLA